MFFSLVGGNDLPEDLSGGKAISQQTQQRPTINPSIPLPSMHPNAVGLGSARMVSYGMSYPQATMHSTGGNSCGGGGGRGQYEMMARGQYLNQPRMASPEDGNGQQVPHSSMSAHQIVRTPPQYIMPLPPRGIGVAGNVMGGGVRPFQQLSATVSSQQKPFLTQPSHPQQTLPPMDKTQSPFSLQPATSSSAPQNQTQQPPGQQTWPSEPVGPHGAAAHLNAPTSTSQLQPQGATQSGSFMVSWSLA